MRILASHLRPVLTPLALLLVVSQAWAAGSGTDGDAIPVLTLTGAGAVGTYQAGGSVAEISVRALTTGQAVVDLTALARPNGDGSGRAELYVDAGYSSPAGGAAPVTGSAVADAASAFSADTSTRLTLLGNGAVVGGSQARATDSKPRGDECGGCSTIAGNADSYASGVTRGSGNVTITALAVGGTSLPDAYGIGGTARAVASGQSGSGAVHVKAEAYSSADAFDLPMYSRVVRASATTLLAGGSSYAEARQVVREKGNYGVLAEASSVGSGGAKAVAIGIGSSGLLESRASASGAGLSVTTHNLLSEYGETSTASSANVGGALYALPASDDTVALTSFVTGAPSSEAVDALLAGRPLLASTGATWLGAGGYAFNNRAHVFNADSETQYTFTSAGGQHLLFGLFGAVGMVNDSSALGLSVSNNGVLLFSDIFYEGTLEALKGEQLFDLGVLGAGLQYLTITTSWYTGVAGSASGFNYVLGVSAVPAPATWLALLLGLGTLALVSVMARGRFHAGVASTVA